MRNENTHTVYGRVLVDKTDLDSPEVFVPAQLINKRDNLPPTITIGKVALGDKGNYTPRVHVTSDVERYLPLVTNAVKQLRKGKDDWEELFCVGCLGLVEAAKKYDTKSNYAFATLAKPYIMGHIKNYLNPARNSGGTTTSLNEVGSYTVGEDSEQEVDRSRSEAMDALYRSLEEMTKKQREVMVGLYVWGYTQGDVAKALKINEASVRGLRDRALEKVKNKLQSGFI